MLVSVIVPAYNAGQTIRTCLDALLDQDLPAEQYEVIVVDNGSTDDTWTVIQGYGHRLRALRETALRGSYAARNLGIRASRGSIIAFTDADCIPGRGWLRLLVTCFDDPAVGCAAGEIVGLPPGTAAEEYAERKGILSQRHTLEHAFRPFVQTANTAYRREVFDEIGLFAAQLESGGDADFCWRMQERTSWLLRFQETATVLHHHRTSWRQLWAQFERYGRGRSALQSLHPDCPSTSYGTPTESLWRLARLGRQASRYALLTVVSPLRGREADRESLENAFYAFITQAAFLRGTRQSVSPTEFRTDPVTAVGG